MLPFNGFSRLLITLEPTGIMDTQVQIEVTDYMGHSLFWTEMKPKTNI